MILADTSVWIDHLRGKNPQVGGFLALYQVVLHPVVIGEIVLGNHPNRSHLFRFLSKVPKAVIAKDEEVFRVIETHQLFGKGIGFSDAHLVASVLLTPGCLLWTKDKRLMAQAERLEILHAPH